MTLGLKFILLKNRNAWFQKTPFRYVVSIAIMYSCETVLGKVLVSKGWLQSEITVQALKTKKKNEQRGKEGGLRIWNFQG